MATTTTETFVVHVDSRDRDFGIFPKPNDYRVRLPRKYRHVVAARLLGAELPSSYVVFAAALGNTTLAATVNGVPCTVVLPDGNYTQATFPTALQTALSDASAHDFVVSLDAATYRLVIECKQHDFTLDTRSGAAGVSSDPAEWGLGYFMGLPKDAISASTAKVLSPPGVLSLNPYTYMLLDIEELNAVETGGLFGTESGRTTFAKIPLSSASYEYVFTGRDAQYQMHLASAHFRPARHFDRLSVRFRFHDDRAVDFRGVEHSFSIELTCLAPAKPSLTVVERPKPRRPPAAAPVVVVQPATPAASPPQSRPRRRVAVVVVVVLIAAAAGVWAVRRRYSAAPAGFGGAGGGAISAPVAKW